MESETKSLIKVWSTIFASLSYTYFIVSKLPKGKLRLISILPILILYTILPLYLSSILLTGITSFFITWLASFKLILFSFNFGPLTTPRAEGSDVHSLTPREGIKSEGSDVHSLTPSEPNKSEGSDLHSFNPREPIKSKGSDVHSLTPRKPIQSKGLDVHNLNPREPIQSEGSDVHSLTPCEPIKSKGSDVHSHAPREPIISFSRFVFIAAFPIKRNDPFALSNKPNKVLPLNFWSKSLISAILIGVCDRYKEKLHEGVILVIYGFLLYLLVDIIVGLANMIIGPISGLEISQPSDEPYVATSLQDFWGKRWNLMVTDALRHTVYFPVRAFLSGYLGKDLAIGFAYLASFGVSGLVHELIFYYMTRVKPSWEVTWFFVVHGLCLVVEVGLKRALGPKLKLHWVITGPLTIGFVMSTAYLWFFPPLVDNQIDLRTIEEFKSLCLSIKGLFV